ncbi:hypothetical protein [Halomonas koreensis]|uniref:Uncharacterized protein n=1 Tax=Halomonas koreensis TaxID=245385 RepID=A0ABU1G4T2_9GAMM|nr:hypothetical protein [Halomonas koreensis]MDR5867921.1 hypothetical protein [Halomonas koreensis]
MAANDTVQGQLNGILNSNSKLMKTAATQGKQQANQRGLLNSSMGIGASQNAMINSALPIAQQDAGYQQELGKLSATSASNAWGVMANNITDIVAQGMEGIANINANPDISQADKTKMIDQITSMRDTDIEFQKGLYQNMSGFLRNSGLFPNL